MSASDTTSAIYVTDTAKQIKTKVCDLVWMFLCLLLPAGAV